MSNEKMSNSLSMILSIGSGVFFGMALFLGSEHFRSWLFSLVTSYGWYVPLTSFLLFILCFHINFKLYMKKVKP